MRPVPLGVATAASKPTTGLPPGECVALIIIAIRWDVLGRDVPSRHDC